MDRYQVRAERNDKSRASAEHYAEPWSSYEIEFLMEFFPDAKGHADAEAEVAEALGRTIEACRQYFYEVRAGKRCGSEKCARDVTSAYRGIMDDPEDRWWSPDYYER